MNFKFKQILFLFSFIFFVALLFACQITATSQITNVTITIKANITAQVYISNLYRGNTPLTLNIGIGKYPLKLMAQGYNTFETVITVSTTGPKEFSFKLTPVASTSTTTTTTTTSSDKARLIVKADIPCYIYSNNVRIGMTPLDVQIYPGTYEIRAVPTDKNYQPKVEKINIQKGQVLELNFKFLTSQPQNYSVTINANVAAQVLINNKPVGNTPLTISLAPGTYTVTLNPLVAGYSSLTQTITVSQPNQVFNFTLTAANGAIIFNIPNDAKVFINGQMYQFKANTQIQLAPGTYTIRIEYHGLVVEKTITINSNQTITISIGLNLIIS